MHGDIARLAALAPIYVVAALSSSIALITAVMRSRRTPAREASVTLRTNALLALGASPRVANALARDRHITAIKIYREEHGIALREAKQAVERLESSARGAALTTAGVSQRVAEALARGHKVAAIKAYREEHRVGLREAKEAVERLEWTW